MFVAKLPRYYNESHIYELFEWVGKIYRVRLMVDACGNNRGFGFVHFYNQRDAQAAIRELNQWEISPGKGTFRL